MQDGFYIQPPPELQFRAARMPEWLHLLGIGAVLVGCGWIGFAPTTLEWFWTPHDEALAVIIIAPRRSADFNSEDNPTRTAAASRRQQ